MWKIWKNGGSKENYILAKVAKQSVFAAKKKAEKEKFEDIETNVHIIYHIAKQMKQETKILLVKNVFGMIIVF